MKLDQIQVRHWIVTEKLDHCITSGWTKDDYRPPVGTMYKLPLNESIHYRALVRKDFSDYEELIRSTQQEEHSVEKFKHLRDFLNLDLLSQEKHKITIDKKGVVQDGVHRLSILLKKNLIEEEIPDKWIKKV